MSIQNDGEDPRFIETPELPRGDGDPDAFGYPGEKEENELLEGIIVGFAMHDLDSAIQSIEADPTEFMSERDELHKLLARFEAALTKMDKPF